MTRKQNPNSPKTPENRAVAPVSPETSIDLRQGHILDTSGLTESQIQELKVQYASGMIDIRKKAEDLKVDVGALDALRNCKVQSANGMVDIRTKGADLKADVGALDIASEIVQRADGTSCGGRRAYDDHPYPDN